MKKFNLLAVMILVVLFTTLGCSKEKVYVLEQGKTFEVGTDIPEGTYKVEAKEQTSDDDNYTTVIGDKDNPDAVFTNINDMVGKEVDLKKGEIVNSNGTIKLILTKGEK
ncbi:hypothetical protein K0040_11110 [Terrisporobacter petrolearius]|uniref:hypothetical protein n=1 Tax=Terrisporobacter petrolearius TaxID=1460447 RepID=UPI001D16C156|nr:hypothetical protein [Terrisporobacter petrolearius]MCC3864821.1 hypothetical protein [Terrisporobacter petrolearius]